MTHRSLAALIVLNVALLAALGFIAFTPAPAQAQFGGGRQYTMISGEVTGRSNQAAIYIFNLATSQIAPVFYNGSSKEFETFRGRVAADDIKGGPRGR